MLSLYFSFGFAEVVLCDCYCKLMLRRGIDSVKLKTILCITKILILPISNRNLKTDKAVVNFLQLAADNLVLLLNIDNNQGKCKNPYCCGVFIYKSNMKGKIMCDCLYMTSA